MSEPENDMTLRPPENLGYVDLYPLQPLTESDDPERWCHHLREPGQRPVCTILLPVVVHLPGVELLTCVGPGWVCRPGEIRVQTSYRYDGASGPAINDDIAISAALVHDIICTRIERNGAATHPLPSYWARHWLYATMVRAMGGPRWRACADWLGLVCANWLVDAAKSDPC